MTRAFLVVLDSFGVGGAPDAAAFGDAGADTFGHIVAARGGRLEIPNLISLGLLEAARAATGRRPPLPGAASRGAWGLGVETSRGKDTPSGHWEIMGAPVDLDWGYFPREAPCFPPALTEALIARGRLPGLLGNRHASGAEVIAELGEEHVRTGKPIVYTSADSVFQIAAHEQVFGLERLYEICLLARELVDAHRIGRVIARPFTGDAATGFSRTADRRDYATPPHAPTLFDHLAEAGRSVVSIGKIGDIFAHRNTGEEVHAHGNEALTAATLDAMARPGEGGLAEGGLVMTNLVDFDMLHGHRRDAEGYAAALEAFDRRLPPLLSRLRPDDLLILTADHGCDPTWRGTDHTRELVPILAATGGAPLGPIGRRAFADIGQSVAAWLGVRPLAHGASWL